MKQFTRNRRRWAPSKKQIPRLYFKFLRHSGFYRVGPGFCGCYMSFLSFHIVTIFSQFLLLRHKMSDGRKLIPFKNWQEGRPKAAKMMF